MKKEGYYSSGEIARMAHVTLRTIRYYDKQNILKPSFVTEAGARFYTDADLARLQQILLLKYLGFALEDIKEMTIHDSDTHFILNSLGIQQKLVRDRIEQMELVEKAIQDTADEIRAGNVIDWSRMLDLIHLTDMEDSLKKQYRSAENISARIKLHRLYSANPKGWFTWLYEALGIQSKMNVLELGCGDGTLWAENISKLPQNVDIVLSDISEGMLRDARRVVGSADGRFSFKTADAGELPYDAGRFDLIIANHVLFYCDDIERTCDEIERVLKPEGYFICSTYGRSHMEEISRMVRDFDDRIVLSGEKLYDRFGMENGYDILHKHFKQVSWTEYEDYLLVTEPDPLIDYVLSCHGNQRQYILERYKEFRSFVKKRTDRGFHITKKAGIFRCSELEGNCNRNGSVVL